MEYCSAAGSLFELWTWPFSSRESSCQISVHSDKKWLRYRLFRVCVVGGVVFWVDTDALLSSSPSQIWLSWGFGLTWDVTIQLNPHSYAFNPACHSGWLLYDNTKVCLLVESVSLPLHYRNTGTGLSQEYSVMGPTPAHHRNKQTKTIGCMRAVLVCLFVSCFGLVSAPSLYFKFLV